MKTIDVFLGVLVFLHLKPLTKSYRMRSLISFPKGCNLFFDGMNTLTCRGSIRERSMKLSAQPASQRNGLGKPKGYWDVKSRYTLEQHTLSGLPDRSKPFLVLGIESSCDDTGAAIVRSDGVVLSNVVYSQYEIHQKFGGIVPSLAMEAHKGNIEKAVAEALKQAGLSSLREVDAIAVTKGPGLEICLRVGFKKAQSLALEFQKPFVTVHHLEAHCVMARLAGKEIVAEEKKEEVVVNKVEEKAVDHNKIEIEGSVGANVNVEIIPSEQNTEERAPTQNGPGPFTPKVEYPFLALLASGGHTSILLCKNLGEYEVLGGTLDDALGEAFDKAARLLGLTCSSSGGAAVEAAAKLGDESSYPMTVPMRTKLNCDFSYAGLKNAFRMAVQSAREKEGLDVDSTNAPANQMEESPTIVTLSDAATADLCASFQSVAISHVVDRLKHAINYVQDNGVSVTALVVVGGVAANKELRRRLLELLESRAASADARLLSIRQKKHPLETDYNPVKTKAMKLIFPPPALCTDNGVMVAWAGIEKLQLGISDSIEGQEVVARWPLGAPIDNGNATFRKGGLKYPTLVEKVAPITP